MKKLTAILSLIALSIVVQAVGPKIPCMLLCDPPLSDATHDTATGYFFYWGPVGQAFSDSRRIGIAINAIPFDLRVLGLPKGNYDIMMTATNGAGESDPSDTVLWHYMNPNKPTNPKVSIP